MPFDSGSLSFRRFAVVGSQPDSFDAELLDKLSGHALRTDDGIAPEEDYGWNGGRHVLDDSFSFENNVFADALHFALRIDTNRVPSELRRAYKIMEEDAAKKDNPTGFISKKQKKSARENSQQLIDQEVKSGRHRRSKLLPILWDLPSAMVYCNASSKSEEKLHEIFERTFGLTLEPQSAGSLGLRLLEANARRREYEDARPTRFVLGPGGDGQTAEYPWVAKGPEAKDFLGNEFVLWLWQQADLHGGAIKTADGEVSIFFDRSLDLDCAFGQTGRDSLKGDGVARMPEAIDALRTGKVPRKAGLMLESSGIQYTLTLNAEALSVASLKLPAVEEADSPRVVFEERVATLRDFGKTLDALYEAFLKVRMSSSWESSAGAIRKWIIQSTPKPVTAVA